MARNADTFPYFLSSRLKPFAVRSGEAGKVRKGERL